MNTKINQSVGKRTTNFELLRIILMLLIIAHHYVVNSGMYFEMAKEIYAPNSIFFLIIGAWGKTAINCFVFITGYFMCKSHITVKKFFKLIFQIEFYNIGLYFIFVIFGKIRFSPSSFFSALLPVVDISDNFISCFLVFFLFIPFLNILLKHLNEKMHILLIILCLFLYTFLSTTPKLSVTMNYVSWFITLYFISSFIRLYPKKLFNNTMMWAILALFSILVSIISIIVCVYYRIDGYYFISDSNKILAVVTSICVFMFFKNLKIPYNRFINLFASASFGVLLIHANSDTMRYWLWTSTLQNASFFNTKWCYLHFFCSVFGIYIVCSCIDLLRIYLFEKPLFKIYDRVSPRLYSKFKRTKRIFSSKLNIDS